jgi:hypothetical protein
MRFLEFFAANIRNRHARRVYVRAAGELLTNPVRGRRCAAAGVRPMHTGVGAPEYHIAQPALEVGAGLISRSSRKQRRRK